MIAIFELQQPIKIKRFPNSLASVSRISRPPVKVLGVNTLKPTPSSTVINYIRSILEEVL